MTLDQLHVLKALADLGSVKAASQALNKTQPAISQSLKQLENQLDLTLLDRTGYRLTLNEHGQRIYQLAQRLLKQADEIQLLSQHLSQGHEANITLAFDGAFDTHRLMPILERSQSLFPNTQITLRQESLSGALQAVLQGSADLALTPLLPDMQAQYDLDTIALTHQTLITVAAPKLLMRHGQLENVEQLREEYQIVVQDSGQLTLGKEFGVKAGQRKWYVNDLLIKKSLILGGMGWGRMPHNLIETELAQGSLQALHLKGEQMQVSVPHHGIRLRHHSFGPVNEMLWQALIELSQSMASKHP